MLQRLLCLMLCLSLLPFSAVQADDAVTQVEELLQSVPKTDSLENQQLRESYQQALQYARDAQRYREQGKAYQQILIDYPKESARLKESLHNYQPQPRPPLSSLKEETLRQAISLSSNRQINLRKERQAVTDSLNQLESTGQEYHVRVDELRKQLLQTRSQLDRLSFSNESDRLQEAQQLATRLKEQSLSDRIQMLELEQLSAQQRNDLGKLKLQELNLAITDEDEWQNSLLAQQNQLRREKTVQALAESERLRRQLTSDLPLLQEQQQQNQALSLQLGALEDQIERVQDEQRGVDTSLSGLNDLVNSVREQLEWLQISNAYGENLRSKLADLPAYFPLEKLESDIVKARMAKYQYETEQDALKDPAQIRNELLSGDEITLDRAQRAVLDNLLKARRQLLTRLNDASDTLIQEQTRLKLLYSRQNSKIDEIREISASHLFWMPDVRPLTPAVLLGVPTALSLLLDPVNWLQLPRAIVENNPMTLTLAGLGLLVLAWCWAKLGRHLVQYSHYIAPRIGKVTQDKFSLTSRLLMRSLLAALPLPAMVLMVRGLLDGAWQYPFAVAVARGLGEIWFLLLALLVARHLTLEKGILILHFRWQKERVQKVWGQFRTLLLVLIPSFFVQGMANSYQEHAFYDSLGRLAFIVGALWLLLFFARLNREKLPLTWGQADMTKPHLLHHFIWNSLMLAPLLAVLGTLFGYFYTSRILLRQLELSLLAGLGCLLVYYLAHRWMLIQRRRLAFDRAKSKRAEILAQREREDDDLSSEIPDVVEEPELDLDTISAQSLGLVRTLLMLGFTMLVLVQWSDLNSAFSFLSSIEVWQVSSKVAGIEQLSAITLQDLMLTAFAFILTVVTARNLPGLMELTLLQHLSLSPGTGFALTTVSKYLVILIGALTGFSMLGIDWSKTQWLVAALSVGLGFGLQEIFANFVSGLIILFEKPIRLGDTVTIRDLTGTVTKIKTRATTIVDWDRKEIIVPNKAFITEQFINWSLSDAITRVKLRIRIGLTQEPKRVQQLLEQCVQESTLVLDTPTPEVFLIEFTDSALIYEIRLYVNNMDHRMPITHEVHSLILEKLNQLGMHLPHQQIDIRMSRG
ncbi:MAG: miniconductance mechanosensitive channel MscM [Aeromonas sp.]|jgi:small-conductance mechanosensitive channel|uniref:Miniconductance mechanosensitive channel MscM n=5 Tax=Aeromonas media TaxID=651 RepID=A0A6M4YVB0_AERME|nr:miniconductance mechanosensitive channel MscM [Aeromonas media]MBP6071715.1 miniconductance mechanosensitive channel MscM [Aeromonas sp.]MBP6166634.1 miniconductance mechanosensitive channel MscM [Aeromonas sp.]MBP8078744.1 miniconductance mechanosensitive channel MscM [Aeromonas sp.]MBP8188088.1 miniconductance mechanosensitive channel MscM [Aeromonas sp.]MCV3287201.1 miniconductance mechanosensitive channel MscM [Aeromonas media]